MNVISFILFTCALVYANWSTANTLVVGELNSYQTIKSAIADAVESDTIIVKSGFYKEGNISIDKAITFIGENFPVIDGNGRKLLNPESHTWSTLFEIEEDHFH